MDFTILFNSALIGIVLSAGCYLFGVWLQKKTKLVILNPILVGMVLCVVIMHTTSLTLEQFQIGGQMLQFFLLPAVCALALNIYHQRKILQTYFLPIICGCLVASIVSMVSIYLLCQLFGLTQEVTMSVVPKSVTSAIAIEVTNHLGGIPAITILCVNITGIGGAILAPTLVKLFKLTDPIEIGIAIGASSHVVGTTKAVEMGEIHGAMSSVAIGISGLITVILGLLL